MKITQEVDAKYYTKPFRELTVLYPELNAFLISISPPKFNLGDSKVLSYINKCLYKEMLDLNISVPEGFLIPTLGIRYAYVDTIISKLESNAKCVEIGTGASAAISLIIAKKYQKKVLATEIDEQSILSASKNISNNNLEEKIDLLKSNGQIITGLIPKGRYSSLFCYPPIYDEDLTKLKKKRGWKGISSELIGGGIDGLDFTRQLIFEALNSNEIYFELISVMLMDEEQIIQLLDIIEEHISREVIKINAGTRKRFVLILKK